MKNIKILLLCSTILIVSILVFSCSKNGEITVQETDEVILDETEQISLQETEVITIQETDELLVQETDDEIVQETDEVSVQETDEVSLEETKQVGVIDYRENHQAYFALRVTDMDKSIEFYKDIFGFKVLFNITDWVELSLPCDCVRLGLSLVEEGNVTQGSGQILFYVDNVNRVKEYLTSKGAEFRDVDIGYTGGMEVGRSRYGYGFFYFDRSIWERNIVCWQ